MGRGRHVFCEQDNADMATVNAQLAIMLPLHGLRLHNVVSRWDGNGMRWADPIPELHYDYVEIGYGYA